MARQPVGLVKAGKYWRRKTLLTGILAVSLAVGVVLAKQQQGIRRRAASSRKASACRLAVSFQRGGASPTREYMNELSSTAKSIGACSNYQSIYWDKVETSPGQFDWSEPDKYINIQSQYGIRPLGRLWMTPKFYSSAPMNKMLNDGGNNDDYNTYARFYAPKLSNLNEWARFVKLAAQRYKDKIDVWLLYHEPQEGLYFQTPGNYHHPIRGTETANGKPAGLGYKNFRDAAYYYYLTQRYGSTVIKDISPGARLYLTAFNPKRSDFLDFFKQLVRRPGFRNSFDIVRIVNYAYPSLNRLGLNKPGAAAANFYDSDGKPGAELSQAFSQMSEAIRTNVSSSEGILHGMGIDRKMFAETGINSDYNNDYRLEPGGGRLQADSLSNIIQAYLNISDIGRLYIFRLANSDPNEPGMTEGQKVWRTLGLYRIRKVSGGYRLGTAKKSAGVFKQLAEHYNSEANNQPEKVGSGRYFSDNAPCRGLSQRSCIFDTRKVFLDKNSGKLYELIVVRNYLFMAPYDDSPARWEKINLKTLFRKVDPNFRFCDQRKTDLPCLIDSISIRQLVNGYAISFTFQNKKYKIINNFNRFPEYIINEHDQANLITLNENSNRYTEANGPCHSRGDRDCFFNTRAFKTDRTGWLIESVTKGEYMYNLNFKNRIWREEKLDKNNAKYGIDPNAPCHNMDLCVFDTDTYFFQNGRPVEEVTIGNTLYHLNIATGVWSKNSPDLAPTPLPTVTPTSTPPPTPAPRKLPTVDGLAVSVNSGTAACTRDTRPSWQWITSANGNEISDYSINKTWGSVKTVSCTKNSYDHTCIMSNTNGFFVPRNSLDAHSKTGTFAIKVKAVSPGGDSEYSDVVAVTLDTQPPALPSKPAASYDSSTNSITLTWQPSSDEGCASINGKAKKYWLNANWNGATNPPAIDSWHEPSDKANPSYVVSCAGHVGQTLQFDVRQAADSLGNKSADLGDWTNTVTVKCPAPPTPAPRKLPTVDGLAVSVNSGTIACTRDTRPSWQWVTSANGNEISNYFIDKNWGYHNVNCAQNTYDNTCIMSNANGFFVPRNPLSNHARTGTFKVRVKAVSPGGDSEYSDMVAITLDARPPAAPAQPAANYDVSTNSITLTWQPSNDEGCASISGKAKKYWLNASWDGVTNPPAIDSWYEPDDKDKPSYVISCAGHAGQTLQFDVRQAADSLGNKSTDLGDWTNAVTVQCPAPP